MYKGFTLIELMLAIAILSITSMFSIGGFSELLAKQKVITDTNQIVSLITYSRNLAITQKTNIRICGLANNLACSRNWATIQVQAENNNQKNLLELSKTDLTTNYQLKGNYSSIDWSSFQRKNYLSFNPRGYTNHQNGTLYLCHNTYPALHRAIVVSKSGRTLIKKAHPETKSRCPAGQ